MRIRLLALGIFLFACVVGFSEQQQQPIDFVVVIDTSSSMHSAYRSVSEYTIGPLLKDFLRVGDTFHLISFSGAPRAEISRRVEGPGDIQTIVSRMLLMYPLDPYSDVIAALDYVSRYLSDLPETRQKTVVFISDGEHLPPPSSPYAGMGAEAVRKQLTQTTARLKGNGWDFHFLKVPFEGASSPTPLPSIATTQPAGISHTAETAKTKQQKQSSPENTADQIKNSKGDAIAESPNAIPGKSTEEKTVEKQENIESIAETEGETKAFDVSDEVSDLLSAPIVEWSEEADSATISATVGSIAAVFPEDLGKTSRTLVIPISVHNSSQKAVYLETQAVRIDGADRMSRRSLQEISPRSNTVFKLFVILPKDYPTGPTSFAVEPIFSGTIRLSPSTGIVKATILDSPLSHVFSIALPALFFIVGLGFAILLAILVILLARRLTTSPNRVAAASTATYVRPRILESQDKRDTTVLPKNDKTVGIPSSIMTPPKDNAADLLAAFAARDSDSAETAQQSRSSAISKKAVSGSDLHETSRYTVDGADFNMAQIPEPVKDDSADLLASFAARASSDAAARDVLLQTTHAGLLSKATAKRTKDSAHTDTRIIRKPMRNASLKNAVNVPHYEIKKAHERVMISLFVENQSTLIGRRNVHILKAGATLTLGGGRSDFLVFLVPIPYRIADIRFDGEQCILIPKKPEFFPDIDSRPVSDCIGKNIRVISQKGYELKIRLDRFQDPLARLNQFLHSIELPGAL